MRCFLFCVKIEGDQFCFEIEGGPILDGNWGTRSMKGLGRIHRRYQTPLCSMRRPSDFMVWRRVTSPGSRDTTDTYEIGGTESLR